MNTAYWKRAMVLLLVNPSSYFGTFRGSLYSMTVSSVMFPELATKTLASKDDDLSIGASGGCILLTAFSNPYRCPLSKETVPPVISYRSGIMALTRNPLSFIVTSLRQPFLFR